MVWNVALKVLKYLVMIVQIKWKTKRRRNLGGGRQGYRAKKNFKKLGFAHFAAHPPWRRHRVALQGLFLRYEYLGFSLQSLCWCSRSLPAVAAATAAVAVMDALTTGTGRVKSAQLPVHEVTQSRRTCMDIVIQCCRNDFPH